MSAVILRVRLPPALERLRRRSVADAANGVPAHVTLLYPFVADSALTPTVRRTLANVVVRHRAFAFRLRAMNEWPDTVYASVDPEGPFVALQAELQAAFPDYPIYGRPADRFVPHVTIAEGVAVAVPGVRADPAWRVLPASRRAMFVEVITTDDGRSHTVWRIPLGAA